MRRAVVTGGNGYIGSSLVRELTLLGVEVHALANNNHQRLDSLLPPEQIHVLPKGARTVVDVVKKVEPDAIFHLAAVYAEPTEVDCILSMIEGNVTLGAALLFAATHCGTSPVFVSTGTYWQFSADGIYDPNTLYATTKQAFQDILHFYRKRHLIRSTTLVLYDTFGPGDERGKIWSRLLSAKPGTHFPLTNGHQRVELVHIEDVVRAFLSAAELLMTGEPLGPLYSVHSGTQFTLRELVELVNQTADLRLSLGWGESTYWSGQVFEPWIGVTLPGWNVQKPALEGLVELSRLNHNSTETTE